MAPRRPRKISTDVAVKFTIVTHGKVFKTKVRGQNLRSKKWRKTTSAKCVTHNSREYHVGDMVIVQLIDGREELAVIAEFREPYVALVWVYETKNTAERRRIVGKDIASKCDLILSIYSDVAHVSAIISAHQSKILCMDHVLDLNKPRVIPITEPRDGCFMRLLFEKINARKPIEGSAAKRELFDSAQPEQDTGYPSVPELHSPSPTPAEQVEAIAPGAGLDALTTEKSGNVNDGMLTEDQTHDSPTSPSFSLSASGGGHNPGDQRTGSAQPHHGSASETSSPRSPLPARTVDANTGPQGEQQQPNPLEQRYNQTADSVLSGLEELRLNVKADEPQLPQHFKDGLIEFLGSFVPKVPVFDPEYLWDRSRADNFSMPEGRHLLVTTLPIFRQLSLRERHGMPKYVLIKSTEPCDAMEAHWREYMYGFLREHPKTKLEVQDVTDGSTLTFARKASDVYERLSNAASSGSILRSGGNSQFMIPWNLLNIHGGYLQTVGLRAIQGIWRFRYLATLCERIEQPDVPSVGKHQGPKSGGSAFSGCLDFALLGERGSYSKTHVDLLGSTGIEILFGKKAWFLLDGDMTDEERDEFAAEGQDWQPSPERMKMVPLGPGDTLLMMPGYLSPHLVVTVETCLSSGGMFWDEFKLSRTLENLWWTFQHPGATNEYIDPDVTKLVDAIQERGGPALPEAQELKAWMRQKFSCTCITHCGAECGCFQENLLRTAGCTTWCSCGCEQGGLY